jgi:CheY-like chemotaxis protein
MGYAAQHTRGTFDRDQPPGPPQVAALVIDDDEDARELLAAIISAAGFSVVTARDGREALELLQRIRPGVIFVDLQMPVMTGAEFREVQRRDRDWLRIPTIVMTGTGDEPMLDLAIEETLHKPVRAKTLVDIVRRHAQPIA